MTKKTGNALLRANRAGMCSMLLGGFSVLFINSKLFTLDLAILGAIFAVIFGALSKDGAKEASGTAGLAFGAFVLIRTFLYGYVSNLFSHKLFELNGEPIILGVLFMFLLLIISILYVALMIAAPQKK